MAAEPRITDKTGQRNLPEAFVNCPLFDEVAVTPLSDRDRDILLALLESPPSANEAFRRAAARYKKHHG